MATSFLDAENVLEVVRGETKKLTLVVTQNGRAYSLLGSDLFLTVKASLEDTYNKFQLSTVSGGIVLDADPRNGKATITFTTALTQTLDPGDYVYDLVLQNSLSERYVLIRPREFHVLPSVVKLTGPSLPPPTPPPFTSVGTGSVYLTDVAGAGVALSDESRVGDILNSGTVSQQAVELVIRASYPQVRVTGDVVSPATATLPFVGGTFEGNVPVTLVGLTDNELTITVLDGDGNSGATDTATLDVDTAPTVTSLEFTGGYPAGARLDTLAAFTQTALKPGDTMQVEVVADKAFDHVEVQNFEASDALQTFDVASGLTTTVTIVIGDRNVAADQRVRVRVRNTAGAYSALFTSNPGSTDVDGVDVVQLDDTVPASTFGAIGYPPTQGALKNSESATVAYTNVDADVVVFESPTAELAITNPFVIETPKTVTRIAGSYNDSTVNLRVQAQRLANGATATINAPVIKIAHAAPTVTIANGWTTRGRSGGNDGTAPQDYTITITSNQEITTPDATFGHTPITGGWQIAWTGGPKVWTRTLRIHDDDPKSTIGGEPATYSWQPVSGFTNLAGVNSAAFSGSSTYVLGGFVLRTPLFGTPFSRQSNNLNVAVVDFTKLPTNPPDDIRYLGPVSRDAVRDSAPGVTTDVPGSGLYTVNAVGVSPHVIQCNDTQISNANAAGTATLAQADGDPGYEEKE